MLHLPVSVIDLNPPEPSLRRFAFAAAATVIITFGGFVGWAATAKLDSASIAPGTVVVETRRKSVSSLEPGILRELVVNEGQMVEKGQPLLRLDATQAEAEVGQYKAQLWAAKAKAARLVAELADERVMTIPAELAATAASDPVVATLAESEHALFLARWQTFESTLSVQSKRIAQIRQQIAASKAEQTSLLEQLRYTEDDLNTVRGLFAKGYQTKPHLLELQRNAAGMRGRIEQLIAMQAEGEQQIAQADAEIINARNTRHSDAAKDLSDARAQAADAEQRLRFVADTLTRKVITAPERGVVTDLKYFTLGGTIASGQPILDIVPTGGEMVVEAKVNPADIEQVRVGMRSLVRLLAYKVHKVPVIRGNLVYVSADQQVSDKGEPYFLARVKLDQQAIDELRDVRVAPGMPAEVFIINGERPAIDYFISPLTDNLRRAFREK
jgi:HlyD family secretion protein